MVTFSINCTNCRSSKKKFECERNRGMMDNFHKPSGVMSSLYHWCIEFSSIFLILNSSPACVNLSSIHSHWLSIFIWPSLRLHFTNDIFRIIKTWQKRRGFRRKCREFHHTRTIPMNCCDWDSFVMNHISNSIPLLSEYFICRYRRKLRPSVFFPF